MVAVALPEAFGAGVNCSCVPDITGTTEKSAGEVEPVTVNVSGLPSMSVKTPAIETLAAPESSATDTAAGAATTVGASLTGVTVMVWVVVTLAPFPSSALIVSVAVPLAFGAGVNCSAVPTTVGAAANNAAFELPVSDSASGSPSISLKTPASETFAAPESSATVTATGGAATIGASLI